MLHRRLLLICLSLFILGGCVVSRKKYDEEVEQNNQKLMVIDSLTTILSDKNLRINLLEAEIKEFLQTSGASVETAFVRSVLEVGERYLSVNTVHPSTQTMISQVSDFIEDELTKSPYNGTLRNSKRISINIKKLVFNHTGFSNFLSSNPRYETSTYFVYVIADPSSNVIVVSLDVVPLVAGASGDEKRLISSEEQVNNYLSTIRSALGASIEKLPSRLDYIISVSND